MPEVAAVVFDLDGTLIDSRADIAASANHALEAHGYATLPTDRITSFIGDGARQLIARAAGLSPDSPELEPLLATFLAHYEEHPVLATTLLPRAREVIETLSARALAICTNKPRNITERVLKALGVRDHFRVVCGGGDTQNKKPSAEPLLWTCERLGVSPAHSVLVGDGPQDVLCGKAAGARTIGVFGNIANPEALRQANPDVLVELGEVPQVIQRWDA